MPTTSGGLALTMNFLAAPSNPGTGGYAFSYQDTVGSIVCLDGCPASGAVCSTAPATSELCTHGNLLANPAPYSAFGGGIGFNLNQAMATSATGTTAMPFVTTGSGISYVVSSIPPNGLRLQIDHGGSTNTYCANVTAPSGTIPWSGFALTCYNTPPGAALTGPPDDATQIEFQMVTTATAGTGDFCVTSVSFAP
jgi:hypothetical protein